MTDSSYANRKISFQIITEFFHKNKQLTEVTSKYLNKNISSIDRKFITSLIKGVIRLKSALDLDIEKSFHGNIKNLNITALNILRIGVYQIRHMDSVPNYAAVSTSVEIGKRIDRNLSQLLNAVLRQVGRTAPLTVPSRSEYDITSFKHFSHPKWLLEKWIKDLGKNTTYDLINWNNEIPKFWIRLNSQLLSIDDFIDFLDENKIKHEQFSEINTYFKVSELQSIINSNFFKSGMIYVQNPSSGLAVKLLEPTCDDTIIDACAAPGGKTSHMSELMEQNGNIIACDNNSTRFEKLKKTITRMKASNVKLIFTDIIDTKAITCNKILVDAPCTGTGAIAKHPDIKWRRKKTHLKEMHDLQKRILASASKLLQKNGILVYGTCSLEKEENWDVIDEFLSEHPNFKIQNANNFISSKFVDEKGAVFTCPPIHKIDGGFAVRLIKND